MKIKLSKRGFAQDFCNSKLAGVEKGARKRESKSDGKIDDICKIKMCFALALEKALGNNLLHM